MFTAIFGGLAILSSFVVRSGHSIVKEADEDKKILLKNMKSSDQLEEIESGDFILEHRNTKGGLLDIYGQEIYTKIKHVPYEKVGFGLDVKTDEDNNTVSVEPVLRVEKGVTEMKKNKIRFTLSPYKSFLTKMNFGHENIAPGSDYRNLINKSYIEPFSEILNGDILIKTIKDSYECNVSLNKDDIYKYNFFSLENKTTYFGGGKYGKEYKYDSVAIDPNTIAVYKTSPKRETGYTILALGVMGVIGFGIAGVTTLIRDD